MGSGGTAAEESSVCACILLRVCRVQVAIGKFLASCRQLAQLADENLSVPGTRVPPPFYHDGKAKYNRSAAFDQHDIKSSCNVTINQNPTGEGAACAECNNVPQHMRDQYLRNNAAPTSTHSNRSDNQRVVLAAASVSTDVVPEGF